MGDMATGILESRNVYTSKWNLLFDKRVKEWLSFKPKQGLQVYPCYICRHIFASKNSFIDHVNRRSIRIVYNCKRCSHTSPEDLVFYNPCSFLLHARQHFSMNSGVIDLDEVEISLLPVGLAGFMPVPNIKVLYDIEGDDIISEYINNRFYNPTAESHGRRFVHFNPNEVILFISGTTDQSFLSLKQISRKVPKCILTQTDGFNINRRRVLPSSRILNLNFGNTNSAVVLSADVSNVPIPDAVIKIEHAEENQSQNQYVMPIITKVETLAESDNPSSQNFTTDGDDPTICTECNEEQDESMSNHFLQENKPLNESFRCSVCKLVSPTLCSFEAHKRIHNTSPPHVCPECGKCFVSWPLLQSHLNNVCYHLQKHVRVKCPGKKCSGKIFAQNITFITHFSAVHLLTSYVCELCNETFDTDLDYFEHAEDHHQENEKFHTLFTCAICTNQETFSGQEKKNEHALSHAKDRANFVYVYVCKFCKNIFKTTTTYSIHIQKCSKNIAKKDQNSMTVSAVNGESGMLPLDNRIPPKKLVECVENNIRMVITICSRCNVRLKFQVLYLHNIVSNCPKCGEKLFLPAKSFSMPKEGNLRKKLPSKTIVRTDMYVDPEENTCLLCRASVENIKEHMMVCKYGKPVVTIPKVSKIISRKEDGEGKEDIEAIEEREGKEEGEGQGKRKVEEEISPKSDKSVTKKRRHYNYKSLTFNHKKLLASTRRYPELHQTDEPDQPIPFEGTYHCRLCSFSDQDREVFCDHVLTHRLVSTSYQCMECGECFVVKPSLVKHLQFYHQIFDIDSYLETNNCYDKEAVKKLEENLKMAPGESRTPVKENQCRVCLQQFESDFDLHKHLRVHVCRCD